jgi:hypothetical protein
MGTKNNPKNRGVSEKKKKLDGNELEPILVYEPESGEKYLAAKVVKSSELLLDGSDNPIRWSTIPLESN